MTQLPRPQQQLESYFNDLLTELEEPISKSSDAPNSKLKTQLLEQEQPLENKQRLEKLLANLAPEAPIVFDQPDSVVVEQTEINLEVSADTAELGIVETDPKLLKQEPLSSHWLANGRPNWAQAAFDILLVEVSGLQLAIPLAALGQIHPIDGELNSLFGQAEWFLGIQKTAMGNIKTVNTAKFIMPERYKEQDREQLNYVVAINGLEWGIAVHEVKQPISISPEDIRWRKKREQRPWIAGTVKEHMCILVDIPRWGAILLSESSQ